MDAGCKQVSNDTNLELEGTFPNSFKILAKTDRLNGYTSKVCIQCKNKDQTFNHDNFTVT